MPGQQLFKHTEKTNATKESIVCLSSQRSL
jgi:hypothetical protein